MSWVEVDGAGWSWVEVDGVRWSWVHGIVIPEYKRKLIGKIVLGPIETLIQLTKVEKLLRFYNDFISDFQKYQEAEVVMKLLRR